MIKRLALVKIRPRYYRVTQARRVPKGRDYRTLGLVLIALSIALLILVDFDFSSDPLIALAFLTIGVLGVVVIIRSPRLERIRTLLDVDLSEGVLITPQKTTNGSGRKRREIGIDEVDELLYAMREVPVDESNPRSVSVDAFAVYIRTFDGEVIGVVDACLDHDTSFRVARSLASMLNVGVKQVGKGWKAD